MASTAPESRERNFTLDGFSAVLAQRLTAAGRFLYVFAADLAELLQGLLTAPSLHRDSNRPSSDGVFLTSVLTPRGAGKALPAWENQSTASLSRSYGYASFGTGTDPNRSFPRCSGTGPALQASAHRLPKNALQATEPLFHVVLFSRASSELYLVDRKSCHCCASCSCNQICCFSKFSATGPLLLPLSFASSAEKRVTPGAFSTDPPRAG